ncbi:MAG: hypothetical protein FWG23_00560 [Eggerthellaceae bacterium]|nr:hypothetical protein [Eggerthellaceae bacterium]
MGDLIELLERILEDPQISDETGASNLFGYLQNKEFIQAEFDKDGALSASITDKGREYLSALYLVRVEQTPRNFLEKTQGKEIVSRLEGEGYLVREGSDGDPLFTITDKGREAMASLT